MVNSIKGKQSMRFGCKVEQISSYTLEIKEEAEFRPESQWHWPGRGLSTGGPKESLPGQGHLWNVDWVFGIEGEEWRAEKVMTLQGSTKEIELWGALRVFSTEGTLAHLYLRMVLFGSREEEVRLEWVRRLGQELRQKWCRLKSWQGEWRERDPVGDLTNHGRRWKWESSVEWQSW